jgi:hypothetical protein
MKKDKIADWIYSKPDTKTAEILTRALQQTKDQFLDFIYDQSTSEDILKFSQMLAGLEVAQPEPEKLWEAINTNRENILREYNKYFGK